MQIVSRSEWGAAPPLREPFRHPATEVYLHHTAGPHRGAAGMRSMQTYHQSADPSRNKDPWNDIAYNFVIDPVDLTVYEGRGWGVAPGAQKGHNTGTLAICVMGDFRTRRPTQGLLDLVAELIRFGHDLGEIPLVLTGGHKDAPDQTTTCPGPNLYREIPTIRELLEDTMSDHGPENWDDADWNAFDKRAGKAVMAYWLPDPDGVAPGTQGNPYDTKALHFNTIFRKVRGDTAANLAIARELAKAEREGLTLSDADIDRIIAEHAESFGLIERDG